MVEYPFNARLHGAARDFSRGNFGLWYNKLVPIDGFDKCNASDKNGNKDNRISFYKNQYDIMKKSRIQHDLLMKKHCSQMHFCRIMEEYGYEKIVYKAELKSALVTGLGESHPSETSMVFDHTSGIPYLPASGIKGVTRFAHSVSLLFDDEGNFTDTHVVSGKNCEKEIIDILDETNINTLIPQIFGGDYQDSGINPGKRRGDVIFLDAYPESIPDLNEEILNPHYQQYHGGEGIPPGDYCNPVPVKFLTVAEKTSFVFRVLVPRHVPEFGKKLRSALTDALENQGMGAKTSVGYGRFRGLSQHEPPRLKDVFNAYLDTRLTEEQKLKKKVQVFVAKVNNQEKASSEVTRLFDLWQADEDLQDNRDIAEALIKKVKKKKSKGDFTKQYRTVAGVLKIDLVAKKDKKDVKSPQAPEKKRAGADDQVLKKLNKIIERGYISRKEKNKILDKYKKSFPDLCNRIKALPKKA